MRIAPKPICPTGNWAAVIGADTFNLLFREFAIGRTTTQYDGGIS
jgi:hypothetical protein